MSFLNKGYHNQLPHSTSTLLHPTVSYFGYTTIYASKPAVNLSGKSVPNSSSFLKFVKKKSIIFIYLFKYLIKLFKSG